MLEVPEVLRNVPRRNIRYVLYRLRDGNLDELNEAQSSIVDAVREYYSSLPEFEGFDKFNKVWDIGTDDPNVLHNWDDPSRSDTWWTWGISRFKIVKRIVSTYAINSNEGIRKSFPGVMEYFVALGYAKPHNGTYRIDVNKFLSDVPHRDRWIPLIETDHSLKDANEWQQYYYKYDIELKEKKED